MRLRSVECGEILEARAGGEASAAQEVCAGDIAAGLAPEARAVPEPAAVAEDTKANRAQAQAFLRLP